MRRVLAAGVVAATMLAVAGPAGAATLRPQPVRAAIAEQVAATYPGLAVGNVACPDGVDRRKGVTFTCTVQLPGMFLLFDVTQVDGRGNVAFETVQAVFTKQSLEEFVAANASLPTTATCGSAPWLVARPGAVLTCRAAISDGAQRDVQVTVRDTAGNVTITGVT